MDQQWASPQLDAALAPACPPAVEPLPERGPIPPPAAAWTRDPGLVSMLDGAIAALLESGADLAAFWRWALPLDGRLLPMLAPIARRLGELWMDDTYSFCDVTLVMHRLTLLLIDLESREAPGFAAAGHGHAILLAPVADDQHAFGLSLLALHLRHAGWDVTADVPAADIAATVARRRFAAVGLSIGHDRALDGVAATVRAIRGRSANPHLLVALGGPRLIGRPDLARTLGADLWADEADELVAKLHCRAVSI